MRRERRKSNPIPATPYPSSPSKPLLSSQSRNRRSSLSSFSLGGKASGSSESVKSVTFLSPFPTQSSEPVSTIFSSSPGTIGSPTTRSTPLPGASDPLATSYLDAKVGFSGDKEDEMELDPPVELEESVEDTQHDRFTKHRGSIAASVDSGDGRSRRPSLASAYSSSEKLGLGA